MAGDAPHSSGGWRFSRKTIHIISCRSGFRCSFPDCDQLLVGPGNGQEDFTILGEVGHVYSGSPRGPRYNKELAKTRLRSPQNGLLLCRHHHRLIDRKDSLYPAEQVNRMKHRHEWRMTAALGSLDRPLTWLESVSIDGFPTFLPATNFSLGRVNHLVGRVGSGKTALLELLNSALTGVVCKRWNKFDFVLTLATSSLDRPEVRVKIRFCHDRIKYQLSEEFLAVSPISIVPVFLQREPGGGQDDVEAIRQCYGFPNGLIEQMVESSLICGVTTGDYSVRVKRTSPYLQRELLVNVGNRESQPLKTCSSSETARVLIDIGISVASHIARFRPVILLLDWEHIWRLHMEGFSPYIDYLFSKQALFQTIFVSPQPQSQLEWNGWQKIDLQGVSVNRKSAR